MSIFKYENCHVCKSIKGNRKAILNMILPENIGNEVVDYLQCKKCEKLKHHDNNFSDEYPRFGIELSKVEKQFFLLIKINPKSFIDDRIRKRSIMKQQMKELIKARGAKDKKVLNSFVHNADVFGIVGDFLTNMWSEGSTKRLVGYHMNSFLSGTYVYAKTEYENLDLFYKVVVMYIDYILEDYACYIDRNKINKYIDKVFNPFE